MEAAARALLGALLIRTDAATMRVGRIVEVEAYAGERDGASHARFGPTARNRAMYGPPGRAYVYRVYGMHRCLNVVAGPDGEAAAVLVRAVEPIASIEAMRAARTATTVAGRRDPGAERSTRERARIDRVPARSIASGPALVAAAFSVEVGDTDTDLCAIDSSLRLGLDTASRAPHGAGDEESRVLVGPRVGVGYAAPPWDAVAWRFWLAGNDAVSRHRGTARPGS